MARAAIVLEQWGAATQQANDISSTTFPASPTEGNLLVAIIGNRTASAPPPTPAGWTLAVESTGSLPGQIIFYKIAGPSEPASLTVGPYPAPLNTGFHLYEYSGVSITDPLEGSSQTTGSGTTVSTGNATTSKDGSLILAGFTAAVGTTYDSWTNSFLEQWDFKNLGSPTEQGSYAGVDFEAGTAGTYSTSGAIASGDWIGQTVIFNPLPPPSVVTNTANSGSGSLGDAIDYANLNPGTTITFDIPDTDPGYQTSGPDHWWRIAPTGALPTITATGTTVDGGSQTLSRGDVNTLGPEIEINGAAAGTSHGFLVTSANNLVHGLIINGFAETNMAGIRINGSGATLNTVSGCYIGTNFSGTTAVPNNMGIAIYDRTTANTIGGTTAAERNVISGNSRYGIMFSGILGNPTTDNVIVGNYIGTTAAGDAALANSTGIYMNPGTGRTTVGGTEVAARNVISGNGSTGILIGGSATIDNEVIGNFIGTDATGTTAVGNNQAITFMTGSTGNTIGGTTAAHRNIIAGGNYGITLYSDSNVIMGNYIGTDVSGTVPLGQGFYAVYLTLSGQSNVLGGNGSGEGNLIAYSGNHGIYHTGTGAGNQFSGNSIHSSGGRGIRLNAGANNDKLPPVLASITQGGPDFTVVATVDPGDVIEFYRVNNPSSPVVVPDPGGSGEGFLYLGSCSDGGVATGPHISSVVDADPTAGVLEVTLLNSGLGSADYVTITASNATDGTSEFAANLQAGTAYSIAGRVFEDADFAGTATNWDGGTGDLALANVDVELYDDGDVYLASVSTSGDGSFSFTGLGDGTFKVRVRSGTIGDADTPPANGLHPTVPVTWPYPLADMTWGHGSALIGGQDPSTDDTSTGDNAGPGDTWVAVTISGADVSAVNFGFNYDLVVNGDDDANVDNARSKQGCLRQFIKNSNSMVGVSKSWFQIPTP